MTISIRLDDADQTTVIRVEDELVAIHVFSGDPRKEDASGPEATMLFDADGLERLKTALLLAEIELLNESRLEEYRFAPSPINPEEWMKGYGW